MESILTRHRRLSFTDRFFFSKIKLRVIFLNLPPPESHLYLRFTRRDLLFLFYFFVLFYSFQVFHFIHLKKSFSFIFNTILFSSFPFLLFYFIVFFFPLFIVLLFFFVLICLVLLFFQNSIHFIFFLYILLNAFILLPFIVFNLLSFHSVLCCFVLI